MGTDEWTESIDEKSDIDQCDVAYEYLVQRRTGDEPPAEFDARLRRKIDVWIMPFLCMIYFLQFLDKTLLNYSAAMGIKKGLKGNEFSNLGTIFYASYIFAEPFMSYLLQTKRLAKSLSVCIVLWGAVLAAHAACKTYASLMIVRTLLGILESSSALGVIAIGNMYYTKLEQASRIGYWSVHSGTATMAGALLSFAFQHVRTTRFVSWQILFLVVGLVTVLFGVVAWFYLPDNVTNAWFLDDDEKMATLEHIRGNLTGTESKTCKRLQVYELFFRDKFTWPMLLLTATSQIVTGAIGTFSVTIIGTFGFNSYVSALVQIPLGAIIVIIILIVTQLVSYFGHITIIMASMFVPSVIGAIAMLCLDLTKQKVGNLLSLYLLYSGSCAISLIYVWNTVNTAGHTKRMLRNALTMICFSLSSLLGPQMFRASEFPHYTLAKIAILVTQVVSIPLALGIGYITKSENHKRDRLSQQSETQSLVPTREFEFLDLTDIENSHFRYLI